jgi:glycosyltransferase involved in cell wall biosynthesis
MKNLVSVVTPVYNHEKFIAQTIKSVQSQTYQNWEMLIVDDCSTDDSWELIQKFAKKDSRIKVFKNKINRGLIPNWKFLIDKSKGGYIAFLEGDDVFDKKNLEEKMEIFRRYMKVGMVYCNFKIINEESNVLVEDVYKKLKTITYRNITVKPEEYLYSKILPFSTYSQIMIRRNVLFVSGYPRSFDPSAKVFLPSDWDFNFRISTKNKIYFINNTLLKYRKHFNNNSGATLKVAEHLLMILNDYEREFSENENIKKAIKYMRGKAHYFKMIFYLENDQKKDARIEFFAYIKKYPKNIFRDFYLNLKLFIRLFLPNKINLYFKKLYLND